MLHQARPNSYLPTARVAVFRVIVAILLTWESCHVQAAILYDAARGSLPNEQNWTVLTRPLLAAQAMQHIEQNMLVLNTLGDLSEQAGYFSQFPALGLAHPDVPVVDLESTNFAVDFTMRLVESQDVPDADSRHAGERNRGGFAVIAISENRTGIELQFQHDQILALSNADSAFPVGEVAAFDTTDALNSYRLTLTDTEYRLVGSENLLLTGPLRDYSDVAPSPPFGFPYTTSSFFFFGDDTPRGGAITKLTRFAVAPLGDCSHDGLRDQQDFECFSTIEERDAALAAMGTLPGDIDGDAKVSFTDFLVMSSNFGNLKRNYAQGNLDLVNGVDFADFLILSSNFGQPASSVRGVPEPSSRMTVLTGILLVLACRARPRTAKQLRSQCR